MEKKHLITISIHSAQSIGGDIQVLTTQVDKTKKKTKFKRKIRHVDYFKIQYFRCDNYHLSTFKYPDRVKHEATCTKSVILIQI